MGSQPTQSQSQNLTSSPTPRPSASSPPTPPKAGLITNKKILLVPILASLLFVYGYTSIRAAKSNAQRHRDADTGGEGLSLLNESRRQHGMQGRVQGSGSTITELAGEARSQLLGEKRGDGEVRKEQSGGGSGRSETEEKLRALRGMSGRSREG